MEKFLTICTKKTENRMFTSWYGDAKLAKGVYRHHLKMLNPGEEILLRSWVNGECVMWKANFDWKNDAV